MKYKPAEHQLMGDICTFSEKVGDIDELYDLYFSTHIYIGNHTHKTDKYRVNYLGRSARSREPEDEI